MIFVALAIPGCSGTDSEELFGNSGGKPMIDSSRIDYSSLDRPEIINLLFHPRSEGPAFSTLENTRDMLISVEDGLSIGARLHHSDKGAPTILFFHGNGEIVSDYDDLGPIYSRMGINFLPVDYRGYGRSTGSPTVAGMMRDCYVIFDYVKQWLKENSYTGPIIIMGRSLGSASALELAARYEDEIDGLIIESGFAYVIPLLKLVGVDIDALGIGEKDELRNIDKIRGFQKPALIIHAEYDHIIPFADGQALFNACSSSDKMFLKIPGANHNTIFAQGIEDYMKAVRRLAEEVSR